MQIDKKRWTKSQRELMDLALEVPDRKGLNLNVVLAQRYSGLSSVLRFLNAHRDEKVLPVLTSASSPFDFNDTLLDRLGLNRTGFGLTRSVGNALKTLSEFEKRPFTLLLNNAEFMNPREMSLVLKVLDDTCYECSCPVRVILLLQPVETYHHIKNLWENKWPPLPEILKERKKAYRRMVYTFSGEGLDELTGTKEFRAQLDAPIDAVKTKAA